MDDSTKRVCAWIDARRDELVELLSQFVRIDTTNPGDGVHGKEKEFQDALVARMKRDGFDDVRALAWDDEKLRPNVIGTVKGRGGGKSLLLNGHCDVVPVAFPERWVSPPFTPKLVDGRLYGRGTSDMKGGLAGAYFAIAALKACGIRLRGDLLFASCVGEESQSAETYGTARLVTDGGVKADFAVTCEPSDVEIHIASPALVFFKLIVEGKGSHVSARNQMLFPQAHGVLSGRDVAVDAFEKSLPLVDFVRRYEV